MKLISDRDQAMKISVSLVAAIIAVIAIVVGWMLFFKDLPAEVRTTMSLPLLAIFGLIAVFISMSLVSMSFAIFGLDDKTQAFALPDGSIRAVIALSLIVLFSILSFYLYSNLAQSPIRVLENLSQTEQAEIAKSVGADHVISSVDVDGKQHFRMVIRDPKNPASEDFAKQILVLMGTLVTAISSFYFGSKLANPLSPADSQVASIKPVPVVRKISPSTVVRGQKTTFDIEGDNLASITSAKFILGKDQVIASNVLSGANAIKLEALFDANQPAGDWDVAAVAEDGKAYTLAHAMKVT
ncbi:hypothetical protein EN866_33200 [Mesorhizobium sp. M2D.F.Ca.ET.223.01.1.1]|uniref:hypothetical protein n=1 Tax=Mesorhizobium sp. M2D.F.Ca.ET.223.01.1.1 TaxID=2563940 RepID=UPI001093120E|nr:hypothetical protein [Mesorhizobium sp. M2D.F.Ca.ET.223.01.1.1]TGR84546.1 hypothetical protein EN866_33200 [Mesorhizobium sp. M2D.F.Ca.ET.223.01.1.1]TGT78431.1 hypothetical protein EN802_01960 [bacterium M00.F.Ca.ET.159.01.1.1]TGT89098.1 hypothetical protein EN800_01960 [bacterium M00.F.Ca.ET.157.01.1.1]